MTAQGLMQRLYSKHLKPNQIVWKNLGSGRYLVGNHDEHVFADFEWVGTVYYLRLQDQSLAPKSLTYERFLADVLAA